ncbi:MAG: ABC transporter ATP-binding protein/permease [Oscillospiraceae bacterium]|jgi:ATP-binding cassette subfamily B protein|nr:ABC transporter ATP-binding protein/permease [Oscillospiraceae bacterium]
MDDKKRMSSRYLLKRFAPYFKKYWHYLVFDLFCASLTTICELVLPIIVRDLTNAGISDAASITVQRIATVVLFYLGLRLVDAAANFYMNSTGHVMGAKIETDMRNDLFSHLQQLSYSFYDNTKIGHLMSRITTDLFDVTEFAHHFPEELFIALIKITFGFFMFAQMDIWLAVIIFSVLPVMFLVTNSSRKKMRDAFSQSRHQIGEINAQTEDSLLGIRVVKSFANEEIEQQKFNKGSHKFLKIKRKSYYYMGAFHSTIRLFDGAMYIIVVAAGAYFMSKGRTTAGDFSGSLLMVSILLGSIRRIVEFSEQYNRGMTGIQRFAEVMDELVEIKDSDHAVEIESTKGEIEFRGVRFCYPGTEKCVLNDLNLHIKPGDNIAVVGPSGGGKTTLCNLIPRFYDVTAGDILLDGRNIKEITLHSLRSNIGVVQQDVYLFSGTVKENISYGCPGAFDDDIREAAKKAGAHDFISELPDGYDTYVGERGVKLSGGQKQRIAIARVFLKNPQILILDEATSALDNESEYLVQQSLERLSKGRTTLTIAHRLTTIRNASEILVLTEDGIAEHGSHKELMEKQGLYSELYKMYTEMA